MSAQAARRLDYSKDYVYGSAAPAPEYAEPAANPADTPHARERAAQRARPAAADARAPGISVFAIFGSLFVAVLMIFVVLAQISYNEVARETVRLNEQLRQLTERERVLAMTFESVVDMREIERYARDVLGMSNPDAGQVVVIRSTTPDRAEIVVGEDSQESTLRGFGSFISSLTEYFRRR